MKLETLHVMNVGWVDLAQVTDRKGNMIDSMPLLMDEDDLVRLLKVFSRREKACHSFCERFASTQHKQLCS